MISSPIRDRFFIRFFAERQGFLEPAALCKLVRLLNNPPNVRDLIHWRGQERRLIQTKYCRSLFRSLPNHPARCALRIFQLLEKTPDGGIVRMPENTLPNFS